MSLFSKLAAIIFAPTDDVGAPRRVANADVQTWGTEVEVALNSAVSSGALVYDTRANLYADLAHDANTGAWVVADGTTAYNGIYSKSGASGTGSWTRVGDLPQGTNGVAGDPGSSDVVGTSVSSIAIGTGAKSFTIVESARGWGVGARLRASSDANGANFMEGIVTSYSGTALAMSVDLVGGSGTHADWTFNLTGVPGADGADGANGTNGTNGESFTWAGPWVTATAYTIGEAVSQSGNSYMCVVAHTSGTFSTDLSGGKWQLMAQKGADGAGVGDMTKATYDPNSIAADAFDMDNMVDGASKVAMTAAERTKLSGVASGATANSGDVVGPASAVDSRLVAFDSTTGKLLKDSGKLVSDFATSAQGTKADAALPKAGGTMSGAINCADNNIQRPVIYDYAELVNALGTVGTSPSIDLEGGNVITATVSGSAPTFTFVNPPASGKCGSFTVIMTNGGLQTVTWPGSVSWGDAGAPTLSSAATDILVFTTVDGGLNWYGALAGSGF